MPAYLPLPTAEFEPCPAGSHVARCVGVIDLGTVVESYEGKESKRRKILLEFETPLELMDDDRPFVISAWFTLSMHPKAKLRLQLEAWRKKPFSDSDFGQGGFDIANLIGVPAMLNVTHNDKGKAKISSISPMPKGLECPPAVRDSRFVWLERDSFRQSDFDRLSDRMKEMVMASPEWRALQQPPAEAVEVEAPTFVVDDDDDEEPPF